MYFVYSYTMDICINTYEYINTDHVHQTLRQQGSASRLTERKGELGGGGEGAEPPGPLFCILLKGCGRNSG
jgi:hypothetical protein